MPAMRGPWLPSAFGPWQVAHTRSNGALPGGGALCADITATASTRAAETRPRPNPRMAPSDREQENATHEDCRRREQVIGAPTRAYENNELRLLAGAELTGG